MKSINTIIRESEGFDIQKDTETWENAIHNFLEGTESGKTEKFRFPLYCMLENFSKRDKEDKQLVIEGLLNIVSKFGDCDVPVDEVFIESIAADADEYIEKWCEDVWNRTFDTIEDPSGVALMRYEK
jgi:hypothetical protein